jgi:hypothetical protein
LRLACSASIVIGLKLVLDEVLVPLVPLVDASPDVEVDWLPVKAAVSSNLDSRKGSKPKVSSRLRRGKWPAEIGNI